MLYLARIQEKFVLIKTNLFTLVIHLQKTSSRRLQDVLVKTNILVLVVILQEVFNTLSWRYPGKSQDFFETSSRCRQEVFQKQLQDVLNFKIFWISKVLVFYFTTPLVAAYRGVFRTWSNICNGNFLRKYLTALSCWLFLQKSSIADVRVGWK